jgi:hypothetical protein
MLHSRALGEVRTYVSEDEADVPIRRSPHNVVRSGEGLRSRSSTMVRRTPHQVVPDCEPGGCRDPSLWYKKFLPDGRVVDQYALGQAEPFLAKMTQLVRELNKPACISSKDWLPIIGRAMEFASEETPYRFSFWGYVAGIAGPAGAIARSVFPSTELRDRARKDMQAAWYKLDYWRRRLSTEPDTLYCKGYNLVAGKKMTTQDRWLITQAISGPYQAAYGYAGGQATLDAAFDDLLRDIAARVKKLPEVGLGVGKWILIGGAVLLVGGVVTAAVVASRVAKGLSVEEVDVGPVKLRKKVAPSEHEPSTAEVAAAYFRSRQRGRRR